MPEQFATTCEQTHALLPGLNFSAAISLELGKRNMLLGRGLREKFSAGSFAGSPARACLEAGPVHSDGSALNTGQKTKTKKDFFSIKEVANVAS